MHSCGWAKMQPDTNGLCNETLMKRVLISGIRSKVHFPSRLIIQNEFKGPEKLLPPRRYAQIYEFKTIILSQSLFISISYSDIW